MYNKDALFYSGIVEMLCMALPSGYTVVRLVGDAPAAMDTIHRAQKHSLRFLPNNKDLLVGQRECQIT